MMPLFHLESVSKTRARGSGYTLDIVRLDIMPGETVAVTGASGSGKSTALDMLGMALRPDAAAAFTLCVAGESVDVAACWRRGDQDRLAALRLRHMGYVLQTGGLLPYVTVRRNMALAASVNGLPDSAERVRDLADLLGIKNLLDAMPGTLSIGERQRVAIGRALASKPAVILADEPTAALDPRHADTVLDLFLEAVNSLGVTLVLVTHDERIVARIVRSSRAKEARIASPAGPDGASRAVLEA
jgi:putative ABC transport system ATP-binding protein